MQKELLITAHCFAVVFTRVSRHLSRGVRRILLGQTTCVSSLSVALPQEEAVVEVTEKSSMSLNLCTSIFSIIRRLRWLSGIDDTQNSREKQHS